MDTVYMIIIGNSVAENVYKTVNNVPKLKALYVPVRSNFANS